MNKYEKLAADMVEARKVGLQAEVEYVKAYGDGGACNFDEAKIVLPGWVEQKVKDVAGGWKVGKSRFVFGPNTCCQGMGRTTNVRAMVEYLRGLGYESYVHYVID